ncbi:MAG: V4R domain-containing protein [Candidatus Bathyarchaeia archaeon]
MGRFFTGHQIFDFISSIPEGAALLLTDETGFEAPMFLNALLRGLLGKEGAVFISAEPTPIDLKVERVRLEEIPDITVLSFEVEKVRRSLKDGCLIIHGYLHHVLIREEEDRILKVIESWRERAANSRIVEIFLLRRDAFPSFEKKLHSLTAGSINIEVNRSGKEVEFSFKMVGCCKPEHHLKEFPFQVKDGRLLIKWGEEFTDQLPLEGEDAVKNRLKYLQENVNSIRIVESGRFESPNPYERWLFSQVKGMKLTEINMLFPEKFSELLEKIATWSVKGYVRFESTQNQAPPPPRDRVKLTTRMALAFPTPIALFFLRRRAHTIPIKVYHTLRKSVEAFLSSQLPGKDLKDELAEMELRFQEVTARLTAIDVYLEIGEDPRTRLDLRYLPKIISLTMYYGYGLKPRVAKLNDYEYEVSFPDCFICRDVVGGPACQLLAGTMVGGCSIVFKERFTCNEVECKASGGKACVFRLSVKVPAERQKGLESLIPSLLKPRSRGVT